MAALFDYIKIIKTAGDYRMESQEQKFMELLEALKEIAPVDGNEMSYGKIREYFKQAQIELTDEQLSLVSDYLRNSHIQVDEKPEEELEEEYEDFEKDYFEMYKKDLKSVPKYSSEQLETYYEDFENNKEIFMQYFMRSIIKWVETYKEGVVNINDLLQEGNLAMIEAINDYSGSSLQELKKYVKNRVIKAVEGIIEDQEGADDITVKILGRVNAVNEYSKELESKNKKKVTIAELAESMGMTVEEIKEIDDLSGNKIEGIIRDKQ